MTLQNYLEYAADAFAPTEPMFRLLPADKVEWKPTEKSFTAGQLIHHIAISVDIYAKGIVTGEWGFTSMRQRFVENRKTTSISPEEAVTAFHRNRDNFFVLMGTLTDDDFSSKEVQSPQYGLVPAWRIAMLAMEHHNKHLAEFFMYLKLMGIEVNTGTLYVVPKQ